MFTEQKEETIKEYQKSQTVRIMDMVIVAPVLIYSGCIKSDLPKWLRLSLVGLGIATFVYNADNYFKNVKENKK